MAARLIRIDWPDTGQPQVPPDPTPAEMAGRLAAVRAEMALRGLDALVVYGDREHAANLHWLTGFDPRFEEALLVVRADEALLIAGNECLPYTAISRTMHIHPTVSELVPTLLQQLKPLEL